MRRVISSISTATPAFVLMSPETYTVVVHDGVPGNVYVLKAGAKSC
jgi:hypothetical protein